MRKLKFRIWDEKYNTWVNDPLFMYPKTDFIHQGAVTQQWTGLIDKNGKDIYEGDFINFSINYTIDSSDPDIVTWRNQEVHYSDEHAGFFFGYKYEFQMLDKILPETLEVVGNKFENPDLANKER